MVGRAPCLNNLLLLFPHLGGALMGGDEEQVARSSCRSSNPVRFVFDGWHTALSQVALVLTVSVVCCVLQWGAWMAVSSAVPLLRSHRIKLTTLGSSGHERATKPQSRRLRRYGSSAQKTLYAKVLL